MATAGKAGKKDGPKEFVFSWEGKNKTGKVVRGDLTAASEAAANASLRRQGISVTKLKKRKTGAGGKVSDKDITLFSRQLATMVKSGVPLLQSFDIVGKGTNNPALAKLLFDIKSDGRNRLQPGFGISQVSPVLRRPVLQSGRSGRAGRHSRYAAGSSGHLQGKKFRPSSRRSRAPCSIRSPFW